MKNKFNKASIILALLALCALIAAMTVTVIAAEGQQNAGVDPWKYDLNGDRSINIADVTDILIYLSNNCGHTLVVDSAVEPTCTESGKTEGSHCGSCGMVFTEQEDIPALGHTPETLPAVPATCAESGLTEGKKCSVCGEILIAQEIVPATGQHTFVALEAVEPTCTETGLTSGFACSVCGQVMIPQETVAALGHDFGEWTVTKAANCIETGTETRTCSRCDAEETRELPISGQHVFVALDAVEPTCTETGLTSGFACSVCGQVMIPQETVPATGHTVAVEVGTPPTCTEAGTTDKEYCSVCGAVLQDHETIPATGHTYKTLPAVPATCTEPGLTIGMGCENCDMVFVAQNVIPALGHDYVDGVCTRCGKLNASEGLEYTLNSDGQSYSVKNGTCTDSNVIIPDTYEGMPVTVIETDAFKNRSDLLSVIIPDSVIEISESAFMNCTGLTEMTLSQYVVRVRRNAFKGCTNITSFTVSGGNTWNFYATKGYTFQKNLTEDPSSGMPYVYSTAKTECDVSNYIPHENRTGTATFSGISDYQKYWINQVECYNKIQNNTGMYPQTLYGFYYSDAVWSRT